MKKFIQFVAAIKTAASLAFTAGIMLVTVASMLFGKGVIAVGIIWQAIFLALLFGIVQFMAFSDSVFQHMGTSGRMAFLCASMSGILAVFAIVFQWFPTSNFINWLIFIGLYGMIFVVATIALRLVFRMGGLKYDELLTAYKARHNGSNP